VAGDLIVSVSVCVCVNGEQDQRLLQWQMAAYSQWKSNDLKNTSSLVPSRYASMCTWKALTLHWCIQGL